MNFLASYVVGLCLNLILICGLAIFVGYNIYKLVVRIKGKKAKKNKEVDTRDKEIK